ncbi:MAG: phosphatidylserine decarboxylase [Desulfarculaceae bacterium]|nr:phosphatidylserine decarboxylase [Desulfarculaceae bacterium]
MPHSAHQYIDRPTGQVVTERLVGDKLVSLLYGGIKEKATPLFNVLTSPRFSNLLGFLNYDLMINRPKGGGAAMLASLGVDPAECLDDPALLDTPRKVFERKIRYWQTRPMDHDPFAVVAPADCRLLVGSLERDSALYLKEKFFTFAELIGETKTRWLTALAKADYAVGRLTPDKYHYAHTPVSGRVVDHYAIGGGCHACNPTATVDGLAPLSKNRREVTIIDTDVPRGTGCGLVAMIEVAALMVGEVVQCYCHNAYDRPRPVVPGMFLAKGQPKSLFRPGGSTVVLLFQAGRVVFDDDLLANLRAPGVHSRFSAGLGRPLVETEVKVRSRIGRAV